MGQQKNPRNPGFDKIKTMPNPKGGFIGGGQMKNVIKLIAIMMTAPVMAHTPIYRPGSDDPSLYCEWTQSYKDPGDTTLSKYDIRLIDETVGAKVDKNGNKSISRLYVYSYKQEGSSSNPPGLEPGGGSGNSCSLYRIHMVLDYATECDADKNYKLVTKAVPNSVSDIPVGCNRNIFNQASHACTWSMVSQYTACALQCDENCNGQEKPDDKFSAVTGSVCERRIKDYTCNREKCEWVPSEYEYRCIAGYYGDPQGGCDKCTICPNFKDKDDVTHQGTSKLGDNKTKDKCFMPKNDTTLVHDERGTFYYDATCFASPDQN